ncbi:hypothetical protein M5D96_010678 [Drosophila gunungcola]|uniref:Uncharacterized protein n=1 Tax=Drosophila gunungcola TaxID=103775 RepID=A0A9P9YGF9_9MUSC|nr:hypothetical protein M5D96_010678 [Drosophila gunungcola]
MERESPKKLEDALEEMGMLGVLPYLQGLFLREIDRKLKVLNRRQLRHRVICLGYLPVPRLKKWSAIKPRNLRLQFAIVFQVEISLWFVPQDGHWVA